jgi:hypothetical protein
MVRRIAIAIVAAAVLGLLGFFLLAWRPAIAPIEPLSRGSFPAESIAKGEILAAGGSVFGRFQRNRLKSSRVRAVRSQMNPESGSGGANRGKYRKTYPPSILLSPRIFVRTSHSFLVARRCPSS